MGLIFIIKFASKHVCLYEGGRDDCGMNNNYVRYLGYIPFTETQVSRDKRNSTLEQE